MKKSFPKRMLILAGLLTASAIVSCGESDHSSVSSETEIKEAVTTTEEENVLISDLPVMDWGGRTYQVLGWEGDRPQFVNFEIYAEKETAEVVNDAVFRRNFKIEETYHVRISQTLTEAPLDDLKTSVSAGDHLYDLAFLTLDRVGIAAQNGYYYDLNQVDYIDFSKPWWNPEVNEAVSLMDKLYFTTSDFSLRDKNRTYIIIYNMDMAAQYDLPNLVQTVRDGKWTIDLMTQYVKMVSQDLDGDGDMWEMDQYGLGMDSYTAFYSFALSLDNRLISTDENGIPHIAANTEHMMDSIEKVMQLTCDTNCALFCNDFVDKVSGDPWSVAAKAFNEERELFNMCFTHSLSSTSANADCNYGVLPLPKYDEAQENYITTPDWAAMMFGIPATTDDTSFAGFMLEALSAASMNTTLPAYYEIACKTKYSYNPETGEMLDLIFDNIYYDPAMLYSIDTLVDMLRNVAEKKSNNFASSLEKREKSVQKKLDSVITALIELEH